MSGWKPSPGQQQLEWWLKLALRFGVGGGGLVYETLWRGLRDPLGILAFTLLATSLDALTLMRGIISALMETAEHVREEERKARLQEMLDEQRSLDSARSPVDDNQPE